MSARILEGSSARDLCLALDDKGFPPLPPAPPKVVLDEGDNPCLSKLFIDGGKDAYNLDTFCRRGVPRKGSDWLSPGQEPGKE